MKYLFLCITIFLFNSCKRKTNISVAVYNYALGEPIADANVIIIERESGGGIFSPSYSCKEIAHATTDAKGECVFNKERLKTGNKYDYFAVVNYAYGHGQAYPCGGKTSGYLNIGKTNEEVLNYSDFKCYFKVEYINLLTPSQPGDSMWVTISSPKYSVPGQPYPFGGGNVLVSGAHYGGYGFPYPTFISSMNMESNAGKHVMYTYKKKLGIVTQTTDTIKIYPYETKTIQINW